MFFFFSFLILLYFSHFTDLPSKQGPSWQKYQVTLFSSNLLIVLSCKGFVLFVQIIVKDPIQTFLFY